MSSSRNGSRIDPNTVACLCDCGTRDYIAAAAIDADGSRHLLLARVDAIGDGKTHYDPACSHVPHEQLGPLPPAWRARVQLAPLRCGRPTLAGTPCRCIVTTPGAPCHLHKAANQ
ncbi:hypothetical protein MSM1_17535 [Mycobacterium sp. SM1]|uniref:hypothetical protein n=1 Tax=Mycobacterium sp. SM1 TaxID=2816243 RepID=UPI001BD02589|nr:hypothetical protein [Mycobacterium sp. SM1]MBS4730062.1 hypothetical protein [Mycobacterium sp. SM1]